MPRVFKRCNLIGPSRICTDYTELRFADLHFFWTNHEGGILSDCRSGCVIYRGDFESCKQGLNELIKKLTPGIFDQKLKQFPTIEEFEDARVQLLQLHRKFRLLMKYKLPKVLNANNIAGNLFVQDFPEVKNARARKIIKDIKKIQERNLNHA